MKNNLSGFLKRLKYMATSPSRYQLTKETFDFLHSSDCLLPEKDKLLMRKYLAKNIIHQMNYPFLNEYLFRKVNVFYDPDYLMYYVFHNNKKLFFKKGMSKKEIIPLYNMLCAEQDIRSPHSYKYFNINYKPEDIAVDAGAAEGIWSLDIAEKVKAIYLFECEEDWIGALQATFAPWKEKIHIIKKYVSNKTDEENIRLDDYFMEKGIFPAILKADIEGAEIFLTDGAPELLSTYLRHVILCTYHRENDYQDLFSILERYKFKTQPSDGYMTLMYDLLEKRSEDISRIFRKGLIYGYK